MLVENEDSAPSLKSDCLHQACAELVTEDYVTLGQYHMWYKMCFVAHVFSQVLAFSVGYQCPKNTK